MTGAGRETVTGLTTLCVAEMTGAGGGGGGGGDDVVDIAAVLSSRSRVGPLNALRIM